MGYIVKINPAFNCTKPYKIREAWKILSYCYQNAQRPHFSYIWPPTLTSENFPIIGKDLDIPLIAKIPQFDPNRGKTLM